MCGIVGVTGNPLGKDVLLTGLARLEYRGYDSAGIYLQESDALVKAVGPLKSLKEKIPVNLTGSTGIGHTRWATHGKPNEVNAHPHTSPLGDLVLVHNGVITNANLLKETYLKENHFQGDTDSEVVVHLIAFFKTQGLTTEEAFIKSLTLLKGSYAIALIDKAISETIFVAKNKSPLLIGLGKDANYLASDALALVGYTDTFIYLNDGEIALLTPEKVEVKNLKGEVLSKDTVTLTLDEQAVDKGIYPYYMLKEIQEQPTVLRKIIQTYRNDKTNLKTILKELKQADSIYLVGCGTSYHAGRLGAKYFEELAGVKSTALLASEVAYHLPLMSQHPYFIFLSQSGETADCRQVLVKVKEKNYSTLTITNQMTSTLSRESDFSLPLLAGPEISVASTKAYTAEVAILYLLASQLKENQKPYEALTKAALAMETLLNKDNLLQDFPKKYVEKAKSCFFIGRYLDYEVSLEGALKLKEIAYLPTFGLAAGELKHGPIALIETDTPVLALITDETTASHMASNMAEVTSRGGKVFSIVREDLKNHFAGDLVLPEVEPLLTPLLSILPLQLLAYEVALDLGYDVDKPRNLAKSVTVE